MLKFICCSSCIGYGTVNRKIINHENYPVVEKVKQARNAVELLAEMDFCGVSEAITFHQTMYDCAPDYGNKLFLSDKSNYTSRLKGTLTILPSMSDSLHSPDRIIRAMQKHKLVGLRAYPQQNRYMLDAITCGDILEVISGKKIPLYLSPMDNWEYIFAAMKEFPHLTIIITNYGLWGSERFFFPLINNYKNVYIDTSDYQLLGGLKAFVDKWGSERLLFGTNYPNNNMGGSMATLIGAKISMADKENIAHSNIERLLEAVSL